MSLTRVLPHRIAALLALVVLSVTLSSPAGGTTEQTVGLLLNEAGGFGGYTLFKPVSYRTAYLIDSEGRLVESWPMISAGGGGLTPYLLEDGSLIRSGGFGARQIAWDGTPVWRYVFEGGLAHHDIEVLPNGNVLMVAWERKSTPESIAWGRNPALLAEGELLPVLVIEVEPTGPESGDIVWEWNSWDHLVQNFDSSKDNFGVVASHPELIDLNFIEASRPAGGEADWHHVNGIDYNEEFDQIVLSIRHFSELWVIDHSTTTEEAAGHSGGNSGKGGDLVYRWGNPIAYGAGDVDDQRLFLQHDAQWIESCLPGEGNMLVFNNGPRPEGVYSTVDEIVPPVNSLGNYALAPGQAFPPEAAIWTYQAENPTDFYSQWISGAQRLPNGNTLIDEGMTGTFFEVTPGGQIVWLYVNPVTEDGPVSQGTYISSNSNTVFRAFRYAPDYPGLQGKDLTPGGAIESEKGTTNTPTATAADTPIVTPTATLIETPTPTATSMATATPTGRRGDVDDDGLVTSIDALLMLQYNAGLLGELANLGAGDVNGDSRVDSRDAALILQLTAGLLDELPPIGAGACE